jgi:predicted Zn-dependent peptidase
MNNQKVIFKLKNDINVLIIPLKTQLTHISMNILLGKRHETLKDIEITHFMEHLMGFFTSEKYKDYHMIDYELNRRGAVTNAYVSNYTTEFLIQGFYSDIEFFIDLLSNTLKQFYVVKSIIKQEKQAVIQELKNYMLDHEYNFRYKIMKYMFKKYEYQNNHLKQIKNIEKYNIDNLKQYIHDHILLRNIVICVSCPENKVTKTKKLIKEHFEFSNTTQKMSIKYPIYEITNKRLRIIHVDNKPLMSDNSLVKIILQISCDYMSRKHLCYLILQHILFNFEVGIFYLTLRKELGLIYDINMNIEIDIIYPSSSLITIESSVNYKRISKFIEYFLHILETFIITNELIDGSKNYVLMTFEFKKIHNLTSLNNYYKNFLLFKKPIIETSEIIRQIKSIDHDEVRKLYDQFKNTILKKGLIFYYAKKNMNNDIKKNINRNISYCSL